MIRVVLVASEAQSRTDSAEFPRIRVPARLSQPAASERPEETDWRAQWQQVIRRSIVTWKLSSVPPMAGR
jgi:hypothetical protein